MPDRDKPNERGLFGGVFARGGVEAGDTAWLQAMLDAEAGLARALERAGLTPAGSGEAVTAAARAENFDPNELGGLAALTGNPVPGLARALARQVPQTAVSAVHRGATSQDILDTAAMLLAKRALGVIEADLTRAAGAAADLAEAHRASIMIGRTLLQQAVPVTFGLVAAGWLTSLDEARAGLAAVGSQRLAVQFGGAAGTLASLGDAGQRVALLFAEEVGLARARAALARRPAAGHRPGRRPGPRRGGARQDRQGRHPAGPVRGGGGQRGPRPRAARSRPARPGSARPGSARPRISAARISREPRRPRAGAARPRCRTSATRSRRSPSSAAPGRCPGCSRP